MSLRPCQCPAPALFPGLLKPWVCHPPSALSLIKLWACVTPNTPLQPSKAYAWVQPTQGMPLDCVALVAGRVCIPGLHRTITIRMAILDRNTIPRAIYSLQTETYLQSACKKVHLIVLEFQPEGLASGLLHIWRLQSVLRECRQGDTICVLSLGTSQLSGTAHKGAYILVYIPDSWNWPRGHLQISWSGGQQDLWLKSYRTVNICIL